MKASSQKEHVSAQNHVSIKRLITTFQLEKQTEELFWMPEKPFKALMFSQYCKHTHITTFVTCCKICFQFYNLKAMKHQFKYIFWVVVSYLLCILASGTAMGTRFCRFAQKNKCLSIQDSLLKDISLLLIPAMFSHCSPLKNSNIFHIYVISNNAAT